MMNAKKYTLKGDAKSQAEAIHNTIAQMNGIKAVRVDSFANTVTVDYDDKKVSSSQIESKLKENNYI
ncbi:copper chaperone CopZ [Anaerosolibacter carboniphilus]|uniref:Copper chaperone CopZ n=2 Tax=Anaerosolibacter carboniphilus TaxID=1417629 RepID=A0A841L1P5_9FIRM|nr:copper chaperone CopZ [Anaerosolibacter carboniphilus]